MSDEPTEGWGFPGSAQRAKAHYFRGGMSLCNKWGFYRGRMEADTGPSPDDCPTCRKRLDKESSRAGTPREEQDDE